ncbi:hypothetical protein ODZ83_10415 [Acaricomes phytoseiuli]|uniref:hypothetical protein n=1 Tax=Acaricomes phytoseiuli TaxID=291968 RepID=UPI00037383DB|nr:hypothetical protein [Acaricomes phytoseiuli]MCW1250580.1 hypothetical protein [Acaricomes phytoseiuli]
MSTPEGRTRPAIVANIALAVQALRLWTSKQILAAAVAAIVVAVFIGVATALISSPFFTRDIAAEWWNYPVWLLTSVLSGMLVATYLRPPLSDGAKTSAETGSAEAGVTEVAKAAEAAERRSSRMGLAGGFLAWFAVGCPVCNKLALLALGSSGAISWFAPVQPFLAVAALALTAVALVWRLRGQVACPLP